MTFAKTAIGAFALFAGYVSTFAAASGAPVLRAGYNPVSPYAFETVEGTAAGFSIDLLTEAAARLGVGIAFVSYDNPGALVDALAAGEIDVTMLIGVSPAREAVGVFTAPVGRFTVELSFSDPPPPGALEGRLGGLRVAVSPGSYPDKLIAEQGEMIPVYRDTLPERLMTLLSGEADAVAGPGQTLHRLAARAGVTGRIAPERLVIGASPSAFLVSHDAPDLLSGLDRFISDVRADGTLDAIEAAWFAPISLTWGQWIAKHALVIVAGSAVLVTGLLAASSLQILVHRARRRMAARTQMMLEAFDVAQAGLVVFDEVLRAEVSNAAFDAAFPTLAPGVGGRKSFEEMMRCAFRQGYFVRDVDTDAVDATIARFTAALRTGDGFETTGYGADGRVFSCRGLELSGGRVAIVTTDVSALEESRRSLVTQAGDLQRANDQLEAFTRVAAHDLKSPASSAATLLDWIADDLAAADHPAPAGVMESVDQARRLLRRQVALIGDLLAYARAAVRQGTAVALEPDARLPEILELIDVPDGFAVTVQSSLPPVLVEPPAFDLVIRNLVANAIKHHDRHEGRVHIGASTDGETVTFEVSDDGPGVPPEFAERVFQPFFKLRSHEEVEGSGLGLAMIHAAVTAWAGTISLSARSDRRGTTVRFTVPAAASAERAPDAEAPHLARESRRALIATGP